MNTKNDDTVTILFVGLVIAALVVANTISARNVNNNTPAATPNRNSSEYQYVEKRMQLEGMSSSDSKKAADAVIRFHNAQKNR